MRIRPGIVLFGIVALVAMGCTRVHVGGPHSGPARSVGQGPPPHAPAHGQRRNFQYHYYPGQEVYYAPDRRLYFWIEAGEWGFGARLPDHITIDVSRSVSVELDADTPYAHHRQGGPKRGKGKGKGGPKKKGKDKGG